MSDSTLIIFVKNPELGKVKTRLAKSIGDDLALQVYLKLLNHTESVTSRISASRVIYYSEHIDNNDIWQDSRKNEQVKGYLGEKMQSAIEKELITNRKVCIIGTDCAELKMEHIEEAFQALEKNDFVLGPANDGGYYLLGMKTNQPELFISIEWSTDAVLVQTVKKIESLNKSYVLLPELIDVDNIEDWNLVLDKFN